MRLRAAFLFLALLVCAVWASPALATCGSGGGTCFVVVAGGNSNATTTWSASSGGVTCTCTPASSDAVILDNLAGQLTINATLTIQSLDASGTSPGSGSPYTGTLTNNSHAITINGNLFKLTNLMTWTPTASTASLTFADATNEVVNITTGGHTLGAITLGSTGSSLSTYRFDDTFTQRTDSVLTLTSGTLDDSTNNEAVTTAGFISNSTNTRTVNLGSGTWTIDGTASSSANQFDLGTVSTGLTCTGTSSATILMSGANTNSFNAGGGCTFGAVTFSNNSPTALVTYTIAGAATFASLNFTPGSLAIAFSTSTTTTINSAISWNGTTSTSGLRLGTSNTGSTIHVNNGSGSNVISWALVQALSFTGGTGTAVNCSNCFDGSGNNAWNGGGLTNPPTSGGASHIIGG